MTASVRKPSGTSQRRAVARRGGKQAGENGRGQPAKRGPPARAGCPRPFSTARRPPRRATARSLGTHTHTHILARSAWGLALPRSLLSCHRAKYTRARASFPTTMSHNSTKGLRSLAPSFPATAPSVLAPVPLFPPPCPHNSHSCVRAPCASHRRRRRPVRRPVRRSPRRPGSKQLRAGGARYGRVLSQTASPCVYMMGRKEG